MNQLFKRREGENILNEKAEPCDQHKICFKQDMSNYTIEIDEVLWL